MPLIFSQPVHRHRGRGVALSWRVRMAVVFALASGLGTVRASAQSGDGEPHMFPRFEVGPYLGLSTHSPVGRSLGAIPDRKHLFVGVQVTANVVRTRRWAFGFSPEVVPLLVVSNNPTYRSISTVLGRFTVEDGRGPVAGFAVSPIGLQAQWRLTPRWRGYVSGAGGVVWFTRDVPVLDARAFNYTFEVGGGLRWQYRARESVRLGFKFHHLSNAYTAHRNPGLDAAVILVGYDRAVGSRR